MSEAAIETRTVVLLVQDLYFISAISNAAAKAGVHVMVVKPVDRVPPDTQLALVDLQFPGDWERAVQRIVAAGGEVIAFGPHVDSDSFKRARQLGCRRVLAKSKLMTDLPAIMARIAG